MKLFNKKYLAVAIALTASAGSSTVFALDATATPEGVGNCHLVTNNWSPPNRGGLEQPVPDVDDPNGTATRIDPVTGAVIRVDDGTGPVPAAVPVPLRDGRSTGWVGHPCPQLRPNHYTGAITIGDPDHLDSAGHIDGNLPGSATLPGHFFGSRQSFDEATGTYSVTTPVGQFEQRSPFDDPPGANFINTVNHDLITFLGNDMPNTQPSALGSSDYMLHDGPVVALDIDKTSPADDLDAIIDKIEKSYKHGAKVSVADIQFAIDIIEGNPINRAYSGLPLLHYNGPNKHKFVSPTRLVDRTPNADPNGPQEVIPNFDFVNPTQTDIDSIVGGEIDIDMIYYNQHIESSVILISPTWVQNVPWKAKYHVKVLTGGIEDFSPMSMTFDELENEAGEPVRGPFHASMDQSYFPMLEEGKQYDITIKETFGKHLNLVYTWGWRIHPPRVQVMENALKVAGGLTLLEHEEVVFGTNPQGIGLPADEARANQLAAIAMIGDLSPVKRMWNIFNKLAGKSEEQAKYKAKYHRGSRRNNFDEDYVYLSKNKAKKIAKELRRAYFDWDDRLRLPEGVEADPDATLTLLYVNNTFYGSKQGTTGTGISGDDSGQGPAAFKGNCNGCAHDWNTRPYNYKVTLLNGDHFPHAYMNVDFGGTRGWENQYQDTDPATALLANLDPAGLPNTIRNTNQPEPATTIVGDDHYDSYNNPPYVDGAGVNVPGEPVPGSAVPGNRNVIYEETDIVLDLTTNLNKSDLRLVPENYNGGNGAEIATGDVVEVVANGEPIFSDDRVFPMNTSGTEEFLVESPREFDQTTGALLQDPTQNYGSGCYFTFGRHHAWPNAGGPWGAIVTPPVDPVTGVPSKRKVEIQYNFEPSRRLKIYQFDPLHHDVAVYSLH